MREEKPALGNQDFGGLIQEELQSSSSKASVVPSGGERPARVVGPSLQAEGTCEPGGAWRGVPASPCARPGAKPREDPGQVQPLVNALHTIPILPAMLKIKPPFLRFKDGKTDS